MLKTNLIIQELENKKNRSAWDKGVNLYAIELLENLETVPTDRTELETVLLNGADSWEQFSWGGCSLIYNQDIAERLCCPSELKKTRNGKRRPNNHEEWLDTQARALFQACNRIKKTVRALTV